MDYTGKRVLVTGADGFIGSHLSELLVAAGAQVTALVLYNSFDRHGWLDDLPTEIRAKLEIVRGDVRDPAFVRRIVEGKEIVFHLAALIAIPYSYVAAESYVQTNIIGTLNVLDAAREARVGRVVQTSTSEVYGSALTMPIAECHPLQGQSPYSATKIGADMMAEAYARSFGQPVAILRPFNTFGPRQSERAVIATMIRQILDPACPVVMIGDTTTVRDFTFVEDTARAFLAVGIAPDIEFGRPYNAGSGTSNTVGDILEMIMTLSKVRKPVMEDEKRSRPTNSEVRALLADSARLRAQAGWEPTLSFEDGLSRTIAWWRGRFACGHVRRDAGFMT